MPASSAPMLATLAVAGAVGILVGPLLALIAARVRRPPRNPRPAMIVWASGLAAVLLAAMAWRFPAPFELAGFGVFAAAAVVLAIVDVLDHRLPDVVLLPALGLAGVPLLAGAVVAANWAGVIGFVAGGAGLFVVYLVLALISPRGMGMGDVKLALLLGAVCGYLGLTAWLVCLVGGFVVGAVVSLIGLAARRLTLRSMVPFGPSMILGAIAAILLF